MLKVSIDNLCYMCNCLNKNQFFPIKRLQLFKQKLIPSKCKDHLSDGNPKPVSDFHVKNTDCSHACACKRV